MHKYLIISTLFVLSFANVKAESVASITTCSTTKCDTETLKVGVNQASFSQQSSEFFSSILSTSQWPARWQCGEWSSFNGWLYILSDFAIWLAYFMIPIVLTYFLVKKKEQLPFKRIFALFIAFILACGLTHLIDAIIFWWPAYNLSALIRFITAVVSMGTVFGLVKVIPRAMNMRTPEELLKEINDRKIVEDQLSLKVKELEKLNREMAIREEKMQELKNELEAFSYSVSHDLRSPLRTIHGFSQALEEDFAHKLPDKAKDYLRRVSAASVRMGHLIDDLLELSRISRKDFNKQQVDVNLLIDDIVSLYDTKTKENTEFIVHPNLKVQADKGLLRIVFENILGNAIKYADPEKNNIRIEVGTEEINGKTAFFVKDNGLGFDMKYADRLFGAFQRLHNDKDIEGTGIGLATVRRIVTRHNGKVWAVSEEKKGATFYFTLNV